jgi:hypothetical protein
MASVPIGDGQSPIWGKAPPACPWPSPYGLLPTSGALLQTFACPPVPVRRQAESTSRAGAQGKDVDGTLGIARVVNTGAQSARPKATTAYKQRRWARAVSKAWRGSSLLHPGGSNGGVLPDPCEPSPPSGVGVPFPAVSLSVAPCPTHQVGSVPAGRPPGLACARRGRGQANQSQPL